LDETITGNAKTMGDINLQLENLQIKEDLFKQLKVKISGDVNPKVSAIVKISGRQ
jgi:hypothetical protein